MAVLSAPPTRTRPSLTWRMTPDAGLARAAGAGDEGALEVLLERHRPALVRYCRGVLLDGDEAQDAVQAASVAALRALRGSGPRPVHVRSWLFRIAHHEALRVAAARPSVVADGEAALARIGVPGPADDGVRTRLAELVEDLRVLPERQRGALLMRELSGLGYPEIAAALDATEGAARQAVFEARAGLAAIREGRASACEAVRRTLSDDDRRQSRSRAIRAHLRECAACEAWAQQIRARRRDLRLLFPAGPAIAFAALGAGGGGAAAGTGAIALVGGGGAAAKCAAVCAAAVVAGVSGLSLFDGGHAARHAARSPAVSTATVQPRHPAAAAAARRARHERHEAAAPQAAVARSRDAAAGRRAGAAPAVAPTRGRTAATHAKQGAGHGSAPGPAKAVPAVSAVDPVPTVTTVVSATGVPQAKGAGPSLAPVTQAVAEADASAQAAIAAAQTQATAAVANAQAAESHAAAAAAGVQAAAQTAIAAAQAAAGAAVAQAQAAGSPAAIAQAMSAAQLANAAAARGSATAPDAVAAALAQANQATALLHGLLGG